MSATSSDAADTGGQSTGQPRLPGPVASCVGLTLWLASAPALVEPLPVIVRVATYNASLTRATEGALRRDLAGPADPQAQRIAAVIQRIRPDVLLLQEFDHDDRHESLQAFARNYLEVAQSGSKPAVYEFRFSAPVNTGTTSGLDLDRDGKAGGPADALGFGNFPGQYGMAVYSRFPLKLPRLRTFRNLPWNRMPRSALPTTWYSAEARARLPLSSKSHWDLPLELPGRHRLHLLISHPTPPVFDGPEDRNGRRNHDEIRLWSDYLSPARSQWIVDDRGRRGGLGAREAFIVMGDQNADPRDGDSVPGAIEQLLEHPRIDSSVTPQSEGGRLAAQRQGRANALQAGEPRNDTADFADGGPGASGNLRTDYLLPSRGLRVCGSGIFWPTPSEPEYALVNDDTAASSDHRLVWLDIAIAGPCPAGVTQASSNAATRSGELQRSEISTPTGQ